MAAEVAAPLSQTKKVTMVSVGKGEIGAAKLTNEVLEVMERIPLMVESLTGVNVTKVINKLFLNLTRTISERIFLLLGHEVEALIKKEFSIGFGTPNFNLFNLL